MLVCGGRDYTDRQRLFTALDDLCKQRGWIHEPHTDGNWLPKVHVISGKARGADRMAADWAVVNWCELTEKAADWEKYGKSAGYIRNQEMLDEKPDIVVAFPGGKGTDMMKRIAEKAGVEVVSFE